MENKYQEALGYIIDNHVMNIDVKDGKAQNKETECALLLQELVDKETPMIPELLGGAMTGEPKLYCPKCNYCVNDYYSNKYRCRECGQKLDWSDE